MLKNRNAVQNANRLIDWVAQTPLKDIPLNGHGHAHKRVILACLALPVNSLASNKVIKDIFAKLDRDLVGSKSSQ
jgi:hypothetical protein